MFSKTVFNLILIFSTISFINIGCEEEEAAHDVQTSDMMPEDEMVSCEEVEAGETTEEAEAGEEAEEVEAGETTEEADAGEEAEEADAGETAEE